MNIHFVEGDSSYLLVTLHVMLCTGNIRDKVLEVGDYFNLVVIEKHSWIGLC